MGDQRPHTEVREESAEEAERFTAFIAERMGSTGNVPLGASYWHWKHVANPFGLSPVLTAHADDQLVGLRVFMRWVWQSAAERVPSVRAVDTATHPEFRGRGIFRTLTLRLVEDMQREGIGFVYNTPNEFSRPGYLKMGWEEVGRVPLMIRPVRPVRLVTRVLRKRWGASSYVAERSEQEEATQWKTVDDLCEQNELVKVLTMSDPQDPRYTTARSVEYLRWRYAEIPGITYHAEWSAEPGREHAIIFRLRSRRGVRELSLSDVLVAPGAERAARASVRRLIATADVDFAAAVAAPSTPERRVLQHVGFLPMRALAPILTVRTITADAAPRSPFDIDHWRLSTGDIELF